MAIGVVGNVGSKIIWRTYFPLCKSATEHKTANIKVCEFNTATKEERKNVKKMS